MVFNGTLLLIGIVVFFVIWLGLISALLIRTISHYNRLTKGITSAGLGEVLEAIVTLVNQLREKTDRADADIQNLVRDGGFHFSRIGIVRFNPFADTGGAQSFSIALLDKSDSGIVMTSLYARAGNRWYVKEVSAGKGNGLELSKEERSAIEKAKHR